MKELRAFVEAVRADYGSVQRYRKKYHGQAVSAWSLPANAIRKIGFQMLIGVRVMQLTRRLKLPVVPQLVSRTLRHLYGAELHWDADIAPGISIVHGNGIVISHGARVEPGCILFQNVTLGEGVDAKTRQKGAPVLRANVHVGPGATLLGPIEVGEGSKIMAGAVVDESVPPNSVVRPAKAQVVGRKKAGGGA